MSLKRNKKFSTRKCFHILSGLPIDYIARSINVFISVIHRFHDLTCIKVKIGWIFFVLLEKK